MGTEFELKYRAEDALLPAIRQAFAGQEQLLRMQTTYYDACDGSLSARRWMLRCRRENEKQLCTLKTPGSGDARQEWEVEEADVENAVSKLLEAGCPQELRLLIRSGLVPLCGARFTRIAKTLWVDGAVLELALDSGVLTGADRESPLCEVEVELKSGSEESCRRFAEALAARFGLVPEPKSKFQRAFALYKGENHGSL